MTFSYTYLDTEIKSVFGIDGTKLSKVKELISQEKMDEAIRQAAEDLIQKALIEDKEV
jgi:hypothetical protein